MSDLGDGRHPQKYAWRAISGNLLKHKSHLDLCSTLAACPGGWHPDTQGKRLQLSHLAKMVLSVSGAIQLKINGEGPPEQGVQSVCLGSLMVRPAL